MTDERSSPPPAQGSRPPGAQPEPPESPQPQPPSTAPQGDPDSSHAVRSSQHSASRLREAMNAALDAAPLGPAQARGRQERSAPAFPEPELPAPRSSRPTQAPESGKRGALTAKDGASRSWSEVAKRVALRIALLGLALSLLGAIFVFFMVRHHEANLPSVEQLKAGYDPPQVTRVLARDGTLLANLFTERRTVVAFGSGPSHVKQAFLAAEDASFYEHEGLDYLGMLRAMLANLRAGKTTQGGSTITQQVIKNVLLDSERSYRRK